MITLGLSLIVVALLSPQLLTGYKEVEKEGLDIYVLLDISKSMRVEDVQPNRLKRAKKSIEQLINSLSGDRIGLVPFSSGAYIQLPLTSDYRLAKMFLEVIEPEMIAGGGTDIGAALELARDSFDRSAQGEQVVVVFSDGETHNSGVVDTAQQITDARIYTVGVGTEQGGLVPEYNQQGKKIGYKKNKAGKRVTSRLQPAVLQRIARGSQGSYYHAQLDGKAVDKLIDSLSQLQRGKLGTEKVKQFKKIYQYFLGLGLLLLLAGYLLPERRSNYEAA